MRVLQVIKRLGHGGAERLVLDLARGLADRGHVVAAAAGAGEWSGFLPGPVYEIPPTGRGPVKLSVTATALGGAVRDFAPDIVHSHNPGATAATALATRRGSRHPAVATLHGVPAEQYRGLVVLFRTLGIPVVAVGPGLANDLAAHGYRCAATIHNGIGPAPAGPDRPSVRERLGVPDDAYMVIQVARLSAEKNQSLAIRALGSAPEVVLVCCGDGPTRPDLERLADGLGVRNRVRFLGRRDDARQLLNAADVCTLTSIYEGLGLSLLEAMVANVPVVATRTAGTVGLIQHGHDGLLVDQDDPEALARAWRRVLSDPSLAAELSRNGFAKAKEFTTARMVDEYVRLYEELAARS